MFLRLELKQDGQKVKPLDSPADSFQKRQCFNRRTSKNAALFAVLGLMIPPFSVIALIRSTSWNWIRILSIVGVLLLVIESYAFLKALEAALAVTSHLK